MAEAVVEDPHRFFCHKCSREISSVLPDYTCPSCNSGFIEALDGNAPGGDPGDDSEDDIDVVQPWEILNDVFFMGMNGDPLLETRRHARGRRGDRGERRPGRNNRSRLTFGNLMHLFAMNLNGDLGPVGSLQAGRAGGLGQEIFVGNPGDYAWGREGFDAIVTQLLNQIEATGPPPLPKDKITEIPVVTITQEQVDKSLQCSVCWENFKLDETVRQLVCTHVYHENCIVPWLELHGTCPVCRKPLSSEVEQPSDDSSRRETIRNIAAQLHPLEATASQSRAEQLREINRQVEELRTRYNTSRLGMNLSGSSGSGSSSAGLHSDPSAPSTSSSSESSSGNMSTSSSTSTGNSSSQGNLEDMDVD